MPGRGYGVKKKVGTRRTAGPSPRKTTTEPNPTKVAGGNNVPDKKRTGGPTPGRRKPKPKTPAPKRKTARRTMR